jgi:alpha-L-fucosidase
MKKISAIIIAMLLGVQSATAQIESDQLAGQQGANKPERLEWLKDAGFGIFIHWGIDAQLGTVPSHSMVGASEDYLDRYINELPKTFYPTRWDPEEWAMTFKQAGARYVVLTTKHHSGFCLWDTKTTDFDVMNTPCGRDLLKEYVAALRKFDLKVGFYYSPEDFAYIYRKGVKDVRRKDKEVDWAPFEDDYKQFVTDQVTELFTNYGKIDVWFIDGMNWGISKEVAWKLQPDVLITRGAIKTPELWIPNTELDEPWEANMTFGRQWQYRPNDDLYKTAMQAIETLLKTRARGGAYLLNVGPDPRGQLDDTAYRNLITIGAWNFINHEAVFGTRPWVLPSEDNIFFTRRGDTVYAFITGLPDWNRGERKDFVIRSVEATADTEVEILGQTGQILEYASGKGMVKGRFEQKEDGLYISVVRAQRIYDDGKWPYPVTVKMTNVKPALDPPAVATLNRSSVKDGKVTLYGKLISLGDADKVEVGFEYQPYFGHHENFHMNEWTAGPTKLLSEPGEFSITMPAPEAGSYSIRALVKHPKVTLRGENVRRTLK